MHFLAPLLPFSQPFFHFSCFLFHSHEFSLSLSLSLPYISCLSLSSPRPFLALSLFSSCSLFSASLRPDPQLQLVSRVLQPPLWAIRRWRIAERNQHRCQQAHAKHMTQGASSISALPSMSIFDAFFFVGKTPWNISLLERELYLPLNCSSYVSSASHRQSRLSMSRYPLSSTFPFHARRANYTRETVQVRARPYKPCGLLLGSRASSCGFLPTSM